MRQLSGHGISVAALAVGAAVFTSVVLAPLAGVSQEIGACQPGQTKFLTSPMAGGDRQTTSTSFVNIPDAVFNLTQGGAAPNCIIVVFSALAFAPGSNRMSVRALLNNTTTAQPGSMIFATNDNAAAGQGQARSVVFVFPLIDPGTHQLAIQFRSVNGGAVRIGRHTTVVQYIQ